MRNIQIQTAKRSPSSNAEKFRSKLTKLIPGEVVTGYLVIKGGFTTVREQAITNPNITEGQIDGIMYIAILVLLVLTPTIYKRTFKVTNKKQLVYTAIAFGLWVFSIGGPFDYWFIEKKLLGLKDFISGMLVVIYTISIPGAFSNQEE